MSDEEEQDVIANLAFFNRFTDSIIESYTSLPYASRAETITTLFALCVQSYEKEKAYTDKYIFYLQNNLKQLLNNIKILKDKKEKLKQKSMEAKLKNDESVLEEWESDPEASTGDEEDKVDKALNDILQADEDYLDLITTTSALPLKRELESDTPIVSPVKKKSRK